MPPRGLAVAAAALLGVLACAAPASWRGTEGESLRGMVKIYGSAPRSWVGFEAQPGGEVYALGPPERAAELEGAQGRLLELTVRRGSPAGDGGLFPEVVTVLSWREIR